MSKHAEIVRLRAHFENADMSEDDKGRLEALVEEAEAGDQEAFAELRKAAFERDYKPVPGTGEGLPPGRVLVCPKDPSHYRTLERELGEELQCPLHEVALVPEDAAN